MNTLNIRRFLVDVTLIIGILLIVFIGYKIYSKGSISSPDQVKQTLIENKKIQDKIDSISKYNKYLSDKINTLEVTQNNVYEAIYKNNGLIKDNNNKLEKIKKLYNEKIDSVNDYSMYQLDSFFTKRYP